MAESYDAVVVGSGPNGLAAAITFAREGLQVLVLEGQASIGGGARSAELTLPGFVHDRCSAVHPLGLASPFFRATPLDEYGLTWVHPDIPVAHPLDGGRAVAQNRSLEATAQGLGTDGPGYRRMMATLVDRYEDLVEELLQPILHVPAHPVALGAFGRSAIRSADGLARSKFKTEEARALFAGIAAHAVMPLEKTATASFGLILGVLGHAVGWPFPKGGSQQIANAMAAYLRELGGTIVTDHPVSSFRDLPDSPIRLFDTSARQLASIAGDHLPKRYRRTLERFNPGWGVFKIDFALSEPIPWENDVCTKAGTVHLGGTLDEIARGEGTVGQGGLPEHPFVLLAQPSLFDSTRAPAGKHTAWAYCHVPNGSPVDMSDRIEAQIERFAPGFKDTVLHRTSTLPADLEARNANLIGGSINGGHMNLGQILARPTFARNPYRTPVRGVYLCSASTPPGGGVHGMCGFKAAKTALRDHS